MYHASVAVLKISRFLLRLLLPLLLLLILLILLLLLPAGDVTSRTGASPLPRRLFLYLVLSFQSAAM